MRSSDFSSGNRSHLSDMSRVRPVTNPPGREFDQEMVFWKQQRGPGNSCRPGVSGNIRRHELRQRGTHF